MKKLLKHKGPDGKWVTVASYEVGQYGPRVGVRKDALRPLLEGDGLLNLSIFNDDRDQVTRPAAEHAAPPVLDEIPW